MKRFIHLLFGITLFAAFFWFSAPTAKAQFSYLPSVNNGSISLCRLGINGSLKSYSIKNLRLGWYLDYGANGRSRPLQQLAYFPMLRLQQTGSNSYTYALSNERVPLTEAELRGLITARPGTYWFIGNEPDRIVYQDDIEPHVYAKAYHELYAIIKSQDPTAKVVAGTIVQPTPVRLQYLDLVLSSYSQSYGGLMPVDAWAFHNFILNEASCAVYPASQCWGAEIPPGVNATRGLEVEVKDTGDFELFKEQVIRFRQWMADRGYRNTPAFLSEFGILMPNPPYTEFSQDVVNEFMNNTFDFLMTATDPNIGYPGDENRLVQRFAWYSMDDKINHNGHLFEPDNGVRTGMGDNFAAYAARLDDTVDFFPSNLHTVGTPTTSGGTTTIKLEVTVGNSGNSAYNTQAIVRFFDGNPASGGQQIGSDQTVRLQGCGEFKNVSVNWSTTATGSRTVYVQVIAPLGAEQNGANNQSTLVVNIP